MVTTNITAPIAPRNSASSTIGLTPPLPVAGSTSVGLTVGGTVQSGGIVTRFSVVVVD